mmetsp:Transcript_36990/g.35706  ORF Transcript_36990/g.35706 Transcript_36990/m.35706 type:complete len:119 (-) Transcript_36990:996-1352(-)
MASFMTVCHKSLNAQQILGVINIYNERLQNELTRDAALKAITKVAWNSSAPDASHIHLTNLNSLTPRLFDLLHKTQRSLHLNTLETFVAIINRYPEQFAQTSSQILKELIPFIGDGDL